MRDDIDSLYLSTMFLPCWPFHAARPAVIMVVDLQPLRLAAAGELGFATGVLDRENAALDRVDKDVLGLEVRVVAPCTEELNSL
jgi:hypothetical protein